MKWTLGIWYSVFLYDLMVSRKVGGAKASLLFYRLIECEKLHKNTYRDKGASCSFFYSEKEVNYELQK